jgi:AbrB family looped-hinge helix DNA binding protein
MMNHRDSFIVTLGERGRLVIPAELRHQLGLEPGDRLILRLDPAGGIRVMTQREVAHRFAGILKDLAPGRSLVDELIAERREEARHEDLAR